MKRADPEEEAAFFNDDGEAVEKDEGSSEKPEKPGKDEGDGAPCERCSSLFYAELDKSMKATSKAVSYTHLTLPTILLV